MWPGSVLIGRTYHPACPRPLPPWFAGTGCGAPWPCGCGCFPCVARFQVVPARMPLELSLWCGFLRVRGEVPPEQRGSGVALLCTPVAWSSGCGPPGPACGGWTAKRRLQLWSTRARCRVGSVSLVGVALRDAGREVAGPGCGGPARRVAAPVVEDPGCGAPAPTWRSPPFLGVGHARRDPSRGVSSPVALGPPMIHHSVSGTQWLAGRMLTPRGFQMLRPLLDAPFRRPAGFEAWGPPKRPGGRGVRPCRRLARLPAAGRTERSRARGWAVAVVQWCVLLQRGLLRRAHGGGESKQRRRRSQRS